MIITLENDKLRVKVSSFAGYLESIWDKEKNMEHYWQYDSAVWPRRTSVCFPICGNLTDDEYSYEGKKYTLPSHGFLRENELAVVEQTPIKVVFEFCDTEETRKVYPFAFQYLITEELVDGSFVVTYTVKNTGDGPMYYTTGSHYTYAMPIAAGEKQGDYVYQFCGPQKAGKLFLEGGQIAGKTDDIFHGADNISLDGLFEAGSTILDLADITPKKIAIKSLKSGAFTEVAFEGFDYCVLWAKPGESPFICIEPWTGMLDQKGHDKDITKKLGITKLGAGESKTYTQTITVG